MFLSSISMMDKIIPKILKIADSPLHSNVGMSQAGGPVDMEEDTWNAQMDVNLKSVFLMCKFVLPIMETQKSGAVVNLGSIAALRYIGKPQVGYNATKAAVIQFTKATALIYAGKGVRLNTVVSIPRQSTALLRSL